MQDVCDLAYAMVLDEARAQVLAERGVAATLAAAGAKRVTMPEWGDAQDRLDRALGVVADDLTDKQRELRNSLGLR